MLTVLIHLNTTEYVRFLLRICVFRIPQSILSKLNSLTVNNLRSKGFILRTICSVEQIHSKIKDCDLFPSSLITLINYLSVYKNSKHSLIYRV